MLYCLQVRAALVIWSTKLIIAASGDIRNLIKSFIGLPEAYTGICTMTVNDREFDVVARNAILLLTALYFEPEIATPIMIHIWYSALIPLRILQLLQNKILPLIKDVCTKIEFRPTSVPQAKTWRYDNRSLRLVLRKDEWIRLQQFFIVPERLSAASAQEIRKKVMLAPSRTDYVDRALCTQPPARRLCTIKFREDGILLPFGSSRKGFDIPNP